MTTYVSNFKHFAIRALRAGGYEDDARHVVHADIIGVSDGRIPSLKVLVFYENADIPLGVVYVQLSATGEWVADY